VGPGGKSDVQTLQENNVKFDEYSQRGAGLIVLARERKEAKNTILTLVSKRIAKEKGSVYK
jgi:hypothetical protein